MKKKKTILIVSIITIILLLIAGTTYAFFQYRQTGTDKQLVLGDIFIHYRETDTVININNAMPQKLIADDFIKSNRILNPIMEEQRLFQASEFQGNELTKCVNYMDWKIMALYGIGLSVDYEGYCRGTVAIGGATLEQGLNSGMFSEDELQELTDLNIISSSDSTYVVNSDMSSQEVEYREEFYQLDRCTRFYDFFPLMGVATFQEGESSESFCRGSGTIENLTFEEHRDTNSDVYLITNDLSVIEELSDITVYENTLLDVDLPYFEFTIDGKNTYVDKAIQYQIVLNNSEYEGSDKAIRTERIDDHFLKFALIEMEGENQKIIFHNKSYEELTDTTIFTDSITSDDGNIDRTYRLYMWIGDEVVIGGGDATYDYDMETWNNKIYASVRVDVNANFIEKNLTEEYMTATDSASFKRLLNNDFSENIIVDTDGTLYLAGNNEQIGFNYVWYSGKLWRIVAINPDGSMKLITEDTITTISWGENTNYTTSFIREWLNQEFLPTLYNYQNIIVTDAIWDISPDDNDLPSKPNKIATVEDAVGLLNVYEYYTISSKNQFYEDCYLNIEYSYWLITPYDNDRIHRGSNGFVTTYTSTTELFVRPSINLKSSVKFSSGDGTIDNPYIIEGSREDITNNTTLLNTRYSGAYIKLENDVNRNLFRIVDTEIINNKLTTKLVLNDYVEDTTGEIVTKSFSSSTTLWNEVDKTDTTYWRGYLNNTWIKEIDNTYNETTGTSSILEKGIYYLGYYQDGGSYKNTVCSTINSNVSVKECIQDGNVVADKVVDDYVGLLRVGEMFASQPKDYDRQTALNMWLITPHVALHGDSLSSNPLSANSNAARPTINLKSEIVIKSGSGTKLDPFIVGLPS